METPPPSAINPAILIPPLPLRRAAETAEPALAAGERLLPTCAAAVALVVLGDFLLWKCTPGLSLALFTATVASAMLLRKGGAALKPPVLIPFVLLLASAAQMAIEISFTNLAVVLALFGVLLGELHFSQLPRGWARWSESLVAWAAAPGRWLWLGRALHEQPLSATGSPGRAGGGLVRAARIGWPAILLLALFGGVLASGNRIFGDYLAREAERLRGCLWTFDFSMARVIFWGLLATLALTFFRPRTGARSPRPWARPLPEWRRPEISVALWQSLLILAALNALFFAVNTIDVIYLWMHTAVPEGITGKRFLHEGVNSLIAATVLAGLVLTALFQQGEPVTRPRALRVLAFAWIAQNLVLIAGVFLRLKIYVETEEMTPKRVYVACFLLLVTLGFVFLSAHVRHGRGAGRLIGRCAVATCALFFVMQFLDVVGWVCGCNVRSGRLNVPFQLTLGADAWPVLMQAMNSAPPGSLRESLQLGLREVAEHEKNPSEMNWREAQTRRDRNAAQLLAWAEPLGPLTAEERQATVIHDYYETLRQLRSAWND